MSKIVKNVFTGEIMTPHEIDYSYYFAQNNLKYMRITADLYAKYGETQQNKKMYNKQTFFNTFGIDHTDISYINRNRKIQKRIYNEIKDVTMEEYYNKVKKVLQLPK